KLISCVLSHPSFAWHIGLPDLPSFPTRRSSDLGTSATAAWSLDAAAHRASSDTPAPPIRRTSCPKPRWTTSSTSSGVTSVSPARSEEHTSELQSRENLVCRLLLEKKNSTLHPYP